MENISTVTSETIDEETVYLERERDLQVENKKRRRMARTKNTLNKRQHIMFINEGLLRGNSKTSSGSKAGKSLDRQTDPGLHPEEQTQDKRSSKEKCWSYSWKTTKGIRRNCSKQ